MKLVNLPLSINRIVQTELSKSFCLATKEANEGKPFFKAVEFPSRIVYLANLSAVEYSEPEDFDLPLKEFEASVKSGALSKHFEKMADVIAVPSSMNKGKAYLVFSLVVERDL